MSLLAAAIAGCAPAPPAHTPRHEGPPGAYPAAPEGGQPGGGGDEVTAGEAQAADAPPAGDLAGRPGRDDLGSAADGLAGAPGAAQPAEVVPVAARRPAGMSDFEVAVAAAASRLRRDPGWLVGALERYRRHYRGRRMHLPGMDAAILTAEGVAAVDEALAVARRSKPRPGLRLSPGLSRAARAHARELGRAGSLDHTGRDGSQPHERMARYGRVIGLSGENIGTGWGGAEVMVIGLYVDDGVRGRGHRVNLLEPAYRAIGVGCAPHRTYGTVCVLDLAGELRE